MLQRGVHVAQKRYEIGNQGEKERGALGNTEKSDDVDKEEHRIREGERMTKHDSMRIQKVSHSVGEGQGWEGPVQGGGCKYEVDVTSKEEEEDRRTWQSRSLWWQRCRMDWCRPWKGRQARTCSQTGDAAKRPTWRPIDHTLRP